MITCYKDYDYRFLNFKATLPYTIKYYDDLNWRTPLTGISVKNERKLITELETGSNN